MPKTASAMARVRATLPGPLEEAAERGFSRCCQCRRARPRPIGREGERLVEEREAEGQTIPAGTSAREANEAGRP